ERRVLKTHESAGEGPRACSGAGPPPNCRIGTPVAASAPADGDARTDTTAREASMTEHTATGPGTLDDLLHERRRFAPPPGFANGAVLGDPDVWDRAARDRETYWAEWARELEWFEPWHTVLEWTPPHAKWFVGGKLNAAWNCLDRHVEAGRGERTALVWEGEPGDERTYTYRELLDEVCRFANALEGLGVGKGDRVTIYLPMIPEAAVAMLACARIGAIHSVVFGGFSPHALADRNN